ncbi:tRNA lysidine(34) synthetase TilS [Oxalobacter sp. OttesenSCG-928-P03]|nr:tRNA lysidine(34) synthetase TilS [Oxalobacter sp. OttesenSCG-928-P03]
MTETKAHHPVFEFERVLESVPARVFAFRPSAGMASEAYADRPGMAVAFSGGLDSTALLDLAHAYALEKGLFLIAFHVHHGLNAKADAWLDHCRDFCRAREIAFDARRVMLDPDSGEGTEAAARRARYAALVEMCTLHGMNLLLTAHHEDDQAETVLLQLMRGAGVAGLSGMEVLGVIPGVEDEEAPQLLRPLLAVSRASLESLVQERRLAYVEDDSNTDPRYARNAIRLKVAPVLSGFFPGFESRVSRSAQHMQSAGRLLNELAEMDWETCRDGDTLNIIRMSELGHDRFDNLFRFWLDAHGLRMPSTAWLNEARTQLLDAREDAQVRLDMEGAVIRRYQDQLIFQEPEKAGGAEEVPRERQGPIVWQGEPRISVPAFGGELLFEYASEGLDADWLRARPLYVGAYHGRLMFKTSPNRPTKSLKAHYQERRVPAWERQRLPLLYADDRLLFAAGVGMAAEDVAKGDNRVWIGWVPFP